MTREQFAAIEAKIERVRAAVQERTGLRTSVVYDVMRQAFDVAFRDRAGGTSINREAVDDMDEDMLIGMLVNAALTAPVIDTGAQFRDALRAILGDESEDE